MRSLSRDLHRLNQRGRVHVDVRSERAPLDGWVAVFYDVERRSIEHTEVVPRSGAIAADVHVGSYVVVAFDDRNGNLVPDPNEPRACRGDAAPIEVTRGGVRDPVTLAVRNGADMDAALLDRVRRACVRRPFSNVGVRARLGDRTFDYARGRVGMWSPARFLDDDLDGLFMFDAFDPSKVAVVFVHGIGGTPRSFAPLVRTVRDAGGQSWAFAYPSALPLEETADRLHVVLDLVLASRRPRAIVLVGHSMGGLVAASFAKRHGDTVPLTEVVTIAAPFDGVGIARLGRDLSPVVMPCWRDLCPESELIARLDRPWPEGVTHTLVHAYRVVDGERRGDGTVSLGSQLARRALVRATEVVHVEAGHVASLADRSTSGALVRAIDLASRAEPTGRRSPSVTSPGRGTPAPRPRGVASPRL